MSTLLRLAIAARDADIVACEYSRARRSSAPEAPGLRFAREAADARYFGLRESLSLIPATDLVDVLIQLGEAQAAIDRLHGCAEGETANIEAHLMRLIFPAMDAVERHAGTDLDQLGLRLLRARFRNPWAVPADRQASMDAIVAEEAGA